MLNPILARRFDLAPAPPPKPVLDVVCYNCGEIFLETTQKYEPDKTADATMVQVKKEHRDRYFPADFCGAELPTDAIIGFDLHCPQCFGWIVDSDLRLVTREKVYTIFCDVCGQGFEHGWEKALHAKETGHIKPKPPKKKKAKK